MKYDINFMKIVKDKFFWLSGLSVRVGGAGEKETIFGFLRPALLDAGDWGLNLYENNKDNRPWSHY